MNGKPGLPIFSHDVPVTFTVFYLLISGVLKEQNQAVEMTKLLKN